MKFNLDGITISENIISVVRNRASRQSVDWISPFLFGHVQFRRRRNGTAASPFSATVSQEKKNKKKKQKMSLPTDRVQTSLSPLLQIVQEKLTLFSHVFRLSSFQTSFFFSSDFKRNKRSYVRVSRVVLDF